MQNFVSKFGTTLKTQKPSIIPLQLSAIAEIELRLEDTAKDETSGFTLDLGKSDYPASLLGIL